MNIILEGAQLFQCLICEIMGRRSIFLYALQVVDDLLSIGLLLINNTFQHIELVINFLGYLIYQALLVQDALLHVLALL